MSLAASRSLRSRLVKLTVLAATSATVVAFGGTGAALAAAPAAASGPARSVIVLLHDQLSSTPPTRAHIGTRKAKATADQDSVLGRMRSRTGRSAAKVVHYSAANAFSATVTPAQAAALASDPSVAEVVPNVKISMPANPDASAVTPSAQPIGTPTSDAICPKDPSKPLLEPEALEDTHTASDDPNAKTAQQLSTGTGVKVAYIADGINPNNPDLIRKDGSHVVIDYKAFSADGPDPQDGGAEAYGDASAIAAQGRKSYDLSTWVNPAYPLPAGCNIRILGMAPGASIVALKIDFYTTSIIQAIDYAVSTDHVDVINESFGGNVLPDEAARSAISAFNDMAVAAGATVTVSSGDAGTTSTIGNPATDPNVISVAANTNSRANQQTGYAGARRFGNGKWVNDEISSLSSGGFTQGGSTVSLTAPGEAGWAICDKGAPECTNFRGGTSNFQFFGGTSQSAPLTAGAAALVISAYRSTHDGDSPSPALVKQLLTSTATDLGLPTYEQGAGLLDSRAAVEAALTYPGSDGSAPAGVSSNITLSTSQVNLVGAPGSQHLVTLGVRNVGTTPLTVATGTRDYKTIAVQRQSTPIRADGTRTFPYPTTGAPWVFRKVTFTVPSGTDRLAAAMIWKGTRNPAGATPVVRLTLLDPSGAFVANSRPQGGPVSANYANLDVRQPTAGTWTAIEYTPMAANGYTGPVSLQTTSQRAVSVGQVAPAALTLRPGQSKNVRVRLTLPKTSGDASQAITVASSDGHQTAVAVTERALVPVRGGTGTFTGAITGGNARAGSAAQTFTYAFDVPAGKRDVSVGVKLADNPNVLLETALVDPNEEVQSIGTNARTDTAGNQAGQARTAQMNVANPVPGRWRVVVLVINPVTGTLFSQGFTGTIAFNANKIRGKGVPTSASTVLPRGKTVTAQVQVTNTGIAPINVQVDPRRNTLVSLPLTSPFGSQTFQLPAHAAPTFIVPPSTTALTATASSQVPAIVELLSGGQGTDVVGDLTAAQRGSTISVAKVSESNGTVSAGVWYTDVNEVGPVGDRGAPTATSTVNLTARTLAFDSAVRSSTGDFYDVVTDPTASIGRAVIIAPGVTKTITVQITPNAAKGKVVHGVLNIITPPVLTNPSFLTTGDLVAQVPYTYTVG